MMFSVLVSVKQKFGDKDLDSESDSSSSESEDDDARVSLCCLFGFSRASSFKFTVLWRPSDLQLTC